MVIMDVGIWIRVSTEDQAKGESPKHHEEKARAYASFKDWNVVEKYDLSGLSGKSVLDYPETQRMMKDVADGKIKALIFSKLARLARNVRELLDISDHFQKYNANLVSLEESIDTSTPAGRLLFTVIGALAQWEREEISARIAAAIPVRAKMNKLLGSKPPIGYTVRDKQVVVDEEKIPFIRAVFSTFAEYKSYNRTAKRLGRPNHAGQIMIRSIIRNPIYKGLRIANRYHGHKPKPQDQWVYVNVEPIVSEELWDKCQLIAQQISKKWPSAGKHLFAGLLLCKCGDKLYKDKKVGQVYRCRKCNFQVAEAILIEQYRLALNEMVIEPKHLKSGEDFKRLLEEAELRMNEIQKRLNAAERKIDSLIDLYTKELLGESDFKARITPLTAEKEVLDCELANIEGKIAYFKSGEINQGYFIDSVKSLDQLWDLWTDDQKIEAIKALTDSIEVSEDEITITFYHLPDLLPDSRSTSAASTSA